MNDAGGACLALNGPPYPPAADECFISLLSRESGAPPATPGGEDGPAGPRRHPVAEAVATLPASVVGLEGALHGPIFLGERRMLPAHFMQPTPGRLFPVLMASRHCGTRRDFLRDNPRKQVLRNGSWNSRFREPVSQRICRRGKTGLREGRPRARSGGRLSRRPVVFSTLMWTSGGQVVEIE